MTTQRTRSTRLAKWGGVATLVVILMFPALAAQAGETAIKGRNVYHSVKAEWTKVGDVDGHVIGFFENGGLGFETGGEVTTAVVKGTFDSIKGTGTHQGYLTKTWSDGSTYTASFEGRSKPDGKLRLSEGTFTYVSGTGRFKGIKGEGTYRSTRYPNKMRVTDFEGKRILPD